MIIRVCHSLLSQDVREGVVCVREGVVCVVTDYNRLLYHELLYGFSVNYKWPFYKWYLLPIL